MSERTVPAGADAGAVITNGNVAVPPIGNGLLSVQVMVPVDPTAGVVHVQPAGGAIEENVALTGLVAALLLAVVSVKLTPVAVAGPLLVITAVIVNVFPAITVGEDEVFVIERSA